MDRRDPLPPGLLGSADPLPAARAAGRPDDAPAGRRHDDDGMAGLARRVRLRLRVATGVLVVLTGFLVVVAVVDERGMAVAALGCGVGALVTSTVTRSVPAPHVATRRTVRRASLRLLLVVPLVIACLLAGVAGAVSLRG